MAEKVKPGRLSVTARGLNNALEAGEAHARQKTLEATIPTGKVFRPGVVMIRNSSGAALQRGDCVQLFGHHLSTPSRYPRQAVLVGENFADLSVMTHGPLFAVTLDPVANSGFCEAVTAGAVLARVQNSGSGPYLQPQAGSHVLKRGYGWGIGRFASAIDPSGSEALIWITLEKQIASPPACYHRRSSSHLTVSGIGICADLQFAGQTDNLGDLAEAHTDNATLKIKEIAQHIAPLYELHWSCQFRNPGTGGSMQASLIQYRSGSDHDSSPWLWYPQMHADSGGSPAHTHTVRIGGPDSGGGDDAYLTASGFMVTDLATDDLLRIVLPANTAEVPYTRLLIRPIAGY